MITHRRGICVAAIFGPCGTMPGFSGSIARVWLLHISCYHVSAKSIRQQQHICACSCNAMHQKIAQSKEHAKQVYRRESGCGNASEPVIAMLRPILAPFRRRSVDRFEVWHFTASVSLFFRLVVVVLVAWFSPCNDGCRFASGRLSMFLFGGAPSSIPKTAENEDVLCTCI
jgi:hypothetical protein